jgi:hypothetical protein
MAADPAAGTREEAEHQKGDGSGAGLTLQMEVLLRACVSVLLLRKGSTFRTLRRFLDDGAKQNGDLLALGRSHPNSEIGACFTKDGLFSSSLYRSTKLSILTKLTSLMTDSVFSHFVSGGRSTIDIDTIREKNQFLFFNLAKLGELHRSEMRSEPFLCLRIQMLVRKQTQFQQ